MKSRTVRSLVTMTLLALPIGSEAQQTRDPVASQRAQDGQDRRDTHYSLQVFGALNNTSDSEAHGLINRGSVAGQFLLSNGALHAFFSRKGSITDLGTLGGPDSFVNVANHTVNDKDVVVGYSETSTPDPNAENFCNFAFANNLVCLPYAWENRVMTPLPTLGGASGQALGINNRAQIVGQAEGPNPDPYSPFALKVRP